MPFGIEQDDFDDICNVLLNYPGIRRGILFGSRAMGNYKNGSDIDLAIEGDNFTFQEVLEIIRQLEELGLLLKFDIQNYSAIRDKDVLNHIARFGKVICAK